MQYPEIRPLKQDSIKILYMGTYTEKEEFVEGKASGIYVYSMNTTTGRLTYVSSSPRTVNPSYLTVDNKNNTLYAVNETGNGDKPGGSVSAFRLIANGTQMDFINSVSSQGNYPCYISMDTTGKWVMCANYGSGNVAVLPVKDSGSLGEATMIHQHTGKGTCSAAECCPCPFYSSKPVKRSGIFL